MKKRIEKRIGCELTHVVSGYHPRVPLVEVRETANVIEATGMTCPDLIDEPSRVNNVLRLDSGLIVNIGGETNGIAYINDGDMICSVDEPTGGTHFSLVKAGANGISFEKVEEIKKDPLEHKRLLPVIRPLMEKVGSIINRNLKGYKPKSITLVGGTCIFPGITKVIEEVTGIRTFTPVRPMFVTSFGIALQDTQGLN